MTNRRIFLKNIALLGAATTVPVHNLFAQSTENTAHATVSYYKKIGHIKPLSRIITIPDVGEFKVLKGDFHTHTLFSDGAVMPKDRVLEAIDNGLDVVSITDHINSAVFRAYPNIHNEVVITDRLGASGSRIDQNIPYILAKSEAEKSELILVRGVEIATKDATREFHINCIFVQDVNTIAEANDRRTLFAADNEWRKMLAISAEQGGFNFWNHPDPGFGDPMRIFDELEKVRQKGHLHGIEVFNFFSHYPFALDWCNASDLAPIANTDIHPSDWNAYGHQNPLRPITLVLAKERTYDSVREAFFARRIIGWAAGMVLGSRKWLEQLFVACVTMTKKPGLLELTNKSDIPCFVKAGGAIRELPAQGQLSMYRSDGVKKLTVSNWLVGTNQPLEIDIPQ